MTMNDKQHRQPYDWNGVPRLDPSKIKHRRFVIDSFLARGCIQLIYGAAGTRKTTAMLLAAWSVAQGSPFFGRKTRQRSVLYLDYENPFDVVKSYCDDLKIDPMHPAFTIWDRSVEPTPLPHDKRLEKFVLHCKQSTGRAPWIIFDSWTSLLRAGESGDKVGEATPIFRAIRHLCDLGATCTIIDHTGKSESKGPIGTSAKTTQMDSSFHFSLQKEETSIALDGRSARSVVRITSFLKRFAPKNVGTFSLEIKAAMNRKNEWHTLSVELTKDRAVIEQEQALEGMKRLIRTNPRIGQEELAELAVKKHVASGRDPARRLLQEGTGKHWEVVKQAKGRKAFRVL